MHTHSQALTNPARSLISACVCVPGRKSTTHRCFSPKVSYCPLTCTLWAHSQWCTAHSVPCVPFTHPHSCARVLLHFSAEHTLSHFSVLAPVCCSALPPNCIACVCVLSVLWCLHCCHCGTLWHTHAVPLLRVVSLLSHICTSVCTPLCVCSHTSMRQLPCHLFLWHTSSFSPFLAAHTSTVLLACSVPHLSPVCVHTAQHIPENPTGYFSPTHILSTPSLPWYQGVLCCLCLCMKTPWSLCSLFPTQRVICHLSTIKPIFFFITALVSRPWLFEPHRHIQEIGYLYKSSFPVHTHPQEHHAWHVCAEWCCLCSWDKSVLLHSHLHRASAAFYTWKCSSGHLSHTAHSVTHTSGGATWYLTHTQILEGCRLPWATRLT